MLTKTKKRTSRKPTEQAETDGSFFLKLVVFVLLGTFWMRFQPPITLGSFLLSGFPLGLIIGLLLVHQFEKRQSDRKIWYAVLLVITIACAFTPTGIIL